MYFIGHLFPTHCFCYYSYLHLQLNFISQIDFDFNVNFYHSPWVCSWRFWYILKIWFLYCSYSLGKVPFSAFLFYCWPYFAWLIDLLFRLQFHIYSLLFWNFFNLMRSWTYYSFCLGCSEQTWPFLFSNLFYFLPVEFKLFWRGHFSSYLPTLPTLEV